ncbi:MAG: hypothetical protein LWX83_19610, partial [Anaerolineae bacterium]|nr:hypothetical protein [Anaerolineae bacterium]
MDEELNIDELKKDLAPALTVVLANQLKEACAVSLQANNHELGVQFKIEGTNNKTYRLYWPYCNDKKIFSKYDPDNASEW